MIFLLNLEFPLINESFLFLFIALFQNTSPKSVYTNLFYYFSLVYNYNYICSMRSSIFYFFEKKGWSGRIEYYTCSFLSARKRWPYWFSYCLFPTVGHDGAVALRSQWRRCQCVDWLEHSCLEFKTCTQRYFYDGYRRCGKYF